MPGHHLSKSHVAAWAVHGYTALGAVLALAMAVFIVEGTPAAFRAAFLCMLAATVVDATDGFLARKARVKEVLPGFDGRRLDDVIDFLTYAFLPLLLVWRAGALPEPSLVWLVPPLLAAAYGFSQVDAKTPDGYFLGFPSCWNAVAFYLYLLPWPGWAALLLVQGLAVLTFVPLKYLYPSQGGRLNRWTNILGALWAGLVAWLMWHLPTEQMPHRLPASDHPLLGLGLISLAYPIFYLTASWWFANRRNKNSSD
ncbi:MAG TPA: CDP-alcohol phosphatidyltransferase [Gemmatales bacterium]|nr:CDP-alcohol phosphatidyltransferase [Gemmatales bacterium]HMP60229.1 CDP-alcohol phosphatidyltransferase [Gemmatales bacterium]